MKFITYYYDKNPEQSTFYKDCYLRLKHNLNYFGHELHGENIDFKKLNLEAYDKLNLHKPQYILEKIQQFNDSVVWIDADTTIFDTINEFNGDQCDIGFAIREHDQKTPHAAFIYFNNTQRSKDFLHEWKSLCEQKMNIPWDCTEHCILVELFNKLDDTTNSCKFLNLASISRQTKVRIGISPAGWEYERNKK